MLAAGSGMLAQAASAGSAGLPDAQEAGAQLQLSLCGQAMQADLRRAALAARLS